MANVALKTEVRKETGTQAARRLRRQGFVPAILYGEGKMNIALRVNGKELSKILHGKAGEHSIIDLSVEGGDLKKALKKTVIVKDVHHDYLKDAILHVDFIAISLKEKIVVKIPVVETGEPEGESQGGVLEHILREIEVESLPADLPDQFVIDVSALNIGDSIKVSDIVPPENVKILDDPSITIITVSPPRVEVEAEAPAEEELEAAVTAEGEEMPAEEKKEETVEKKKSKKE